MSGDFVSEADPNYNFKGWNKYFNSYTARGRFNVSLVNMTCKGIHPSFDGYVIAVSLSSMCVLVVRWLACCTLLLYSN